MEKHFNVAEAKAKLSSLIDAAVRGEDIYIDRAGAPRVRLVAVAQAAQADATARRARREAFLSRWAGKLKVDIGPEEIRAMRDYSDERRELHGLPPR